MQKTYRGGSTVLLKNVEDRAAIGAETAQKHGEKRSLFFTAYCTLNKGYRQKIAQQFTRNMGCNL
jgi:hypothetical protein